MTDKFLMDGHKLYWHLDRVTAWQRGERIAPLHIDVGLSKGCNIKCAYCFGAMQGNTFTEGATSYFPREPLLRYLQDAGAVGVRSMAFIGEAEPLLNPHAYEAIVCGKKSGVDIALGTNGTLFDTGRAGEEALENLSWLRFNISAADDASYRRIHQSELFAAVKEKIRTCTAYKRRRGLSVTIGLQMVLIPENVDQVVPLARLGRELGVDYLVVKQCADTVDNTLGVYNRLGEYDRFAEILAEAEALGTPDYSVIIKWRQVTNRGLRTYSHCLGVPFLLYSSGDGRLYPCGMFFNHREEEFQMGDLKEQSFREILESGHYWQIVQKVQEIDARNECYTNCRTNMINEFLWRLSHPPDHVNFI
jgi:radical SAM protein with 4Fe4S-binding SPASM domain